MAVGRRAGLAWSPSRSPQPDGVDQRCRTSFGPACAPPMASGSRMFSSAVNVGNRLNCWNTKPTWLAAQLGQAGVSPEPGDPLGAPDRTHRPGSPRPLQSGRRQCINVDLPEPDRPMIAVRLPRSRPRLTPRRASTAARALAVAAGDIGGDDDLSVCLSDRVQRYRDRRSARRSVVGGLARGSPRSRRPSSVDRPRRDEQADAQRAASTCATPAGAASEDVRVAAGTARRRERRSPRPVVSNSKAEDALRREPGGRRISPWRRSVPPRKRV